MKLNVHCLFSHTGILGATTATGSVFGTPATTSQTMGLGGVDPKTSTTAAGKNCLLYCIYFLSSKVAVCLVIVYQSKLFVTMYSKSQLKQTGLWRIDAYSEIIFIRHDFITWCKLNGHKELRL